MNPRCMPALIAVISFILFMGATSGIISAQDLPIAFLATDLYEFQPVLEGTQITHEFKIQNKGSAPLRIESVKTGWGCTAVSYPKQIPPGGEGAIKIKGNTTGYGGRKFSKTIVVTTNDPKHIRLNFKFSGFVENFAIIKPRHVRLTGIVGIDQKAVVSIIPEKKYPFKILKITADKGNYIQFKVQEINRENRIGYELIVENTKKTKGRFFDTIHLITDSKIKPDIPIRVYGYIMDKQKMSKQ